MKKPILCLMVLSLAFSLTIASVFADSDSSNSFDGWTDDQIVFILGQLKAEINKRGLMCPKDSLASTINNNYDVYDFSEWSDDDLLLSLEEVKEIITEKGLLASKKITPTPKPTSNTSTSKSNAGTSTKTNDHSLQRRSQFNESGEFLLDMNSFSEQMNDGLKSMCEKLSAGSVTSSFSYGNRNNILSCIVYEMDGTSLNDEKRIATVDGFDLEGCFVDGIVGNMATIVCYSQLSNTTYVEAILATIIRICVPTLEQEQLQAIVDMMLNHISDSRYDYTVNDIVYSISYHELTHTQLRFEIRMKGTKSAQDY